jgi:hypothetical protein
LAIFKTIIERLGGSICVESVQVCGHHFYFYLALGNISKKKTHKLSDKNVVINEKRSYCRDFVLESVNEHKVKDYKKETEADTILIAEDMDSKL